MALDGHMFDSNNVMIDFFPIDDDLHKAIFYQKENVYRSYLYLSRLCDYYEDESFDGDELRKLADDLSNYKANVAVVYHTLINELYDKLSNTAIVKVIFYAD
ncbi:hypothetical protein BC351_32445 [Paenibacillus ferrarius]|uniref:Uncharacterized protein n=1 Tax=Paenibacillus ferrarius TaxID=1469647 RepID=A0A1V4HE28_9BACL|nr:hypothetical protein [Paenibacillus ferrarius]OPH52971.1 hypothetical protein BC351_32445 [Paenibacillus ferrarius]